MRNGIVFIIVFIVHLFGSSCKPKPEIPTIELPKFTPLEKIDSIETLVYKHLIDSFKFENYPVMSIYSGPKGTLDISYYKSLPEEIINHVQNTFNESKQPNFAGHYLIITWGCGSPCQENVIIDYQSGATITTINSAGGLEYYLESFLLVVNPPRNETYTSSKRAILGIPQYFTFLGESKILKNIN